MENSVSPSGSNLFAHFTRVCTGESLFTLKAVTANSDASNATDASIADITSNDEPESADSREALISQFSKHDAAGELDQAADILRRMIVRDPKDYEAIFNLAVNTAQRSSDG